MDSGITNLVNYMNIVIQDLTNQNQQLQKRVWILQQPYFQQMNIWKTWRDYNVDGSGVIIGILDDGIDNTHSDLVIQDFISYGCDGNGYIPRMNTETSGTNCAGIIGAKGNEFMLGIAHGATIGSIKIRGIGSIIYNPFHPSYHIYNCNWRDVNSINYKDMILEQTHIGRNNLGSIFVMNQYAGELLNNPFVIGVGTENTGHTSKLLCYAPHENIITTNPILYNGSPLKMNFREMASVSCVSGMIALLLQKYPNLTIREIRQLISESCVQIYPEDEAWVLNGVGKSYHSFYGFGLLMADHLLQNALTFQSFMPFLLDTNQILCAESVTPLLTKTISILENRVIENVIFTFYPNENDINLTTFLKSPQNTTVIGDGMIEPFRGEQSNGTWTILFQNSGNQSILIQWYRLQIYCH